MHIKIQFNQSFALQNQSPVSVIVWAAVTATGCLLIVLIEQVVKLNNEIYRANVAKVRQTQSLRLINIYIYLWRNWHKTQSVCIQRVQPSRTNPNWIDVLKEHK